MSPKRTTAPPARKHSRSSSSGQEGLIAKEKTEKQSAKRRTALDNRFHRTLSPLDAGRGAYVSPVRIVRARHAQSPLPT